MARKAPPKGGRTRKAAPAPKRKRSGAAAPARSRGPSAYERRIERYLREHPGATRQEARGHKAAEHVTRRQREIAKLEAVAEAQAAKFRGADPDEILEALMARYRREGIGFLNRLLALNASNNAAYVANRHQAIGVNLDEYAEVWELPRETFGYH